MDLRDLNFRLKKWAQCRNSVVEIRVSDPGLYATVTGVIIYVKDTYIYILSSIIEEKVNKIQKVVVGAEERIELTNLKLLHDNELGLLLIEAEGDGSSNVQALKFGSAAEVRMLAFNICHVRLNFCPEMTAIAMNLCRINHNERREKLLYHIVEDTPFIQHTGAVGEPGGAPLMDGEGRIIGIYSGTLNHFKYSLSLLAVKDFFVKQFRKAPENNSSKRRKSSRTQLVRVPPKSVGWEDVQDLNELVADVLATPFGPFGTRLSWVSSIKPKNMKKVSDAYRPQIRFTYFRRRSRKGVS